MKNIYILLFIIIGSTTFSQSITYPEISWGQVVTRGQEITMTITYDGAGNDFSYITAKLARRSSAWAELENITDPVYADITNSPASGTAVITVTVPNDCPLTADLQNGEQIMLYCFGQVTSGGFANANKDVTVEAALSTEDLSSNILHIYPNPSSNKIYLPNNSEDLGLIRFYNLKGSLVKVASSYSNGIDVSDLKNGIYILSTRKWNQKFIKN